MPGKGWLLLISWGSALGRACGGYRGLATGINSTKVTSQSLRTRQDQRRYFRNIPSYCTAQGQGDGSPLPSPVPEHRQTDWPRGHDTLDSASGDAQLKLEWKSRRNYTRSEKDEILRLHAAGKSAREIGRALGIPTRSIWDRCRDWLSRPDPESRTRGRNVSPQEKAEIARLRENQRTCLQIARETQRSMATVYRALRDMGISKRSRPMIPWSAAEDAKLIKLRKEGLACWEIEEQMPGRNVKAIRDKLYRITCG